MRFIASSPSTDHPRSCGANGQSRRQCRRVRGSSPLVRGQLNASNNVQDAIRIIPARAGPTSTVPTYGDTGEDHPRSCGANAPRSMRSRSHCGSSPLVRGQRLRPVLTLVDVRIIPARAGPTHCLSCDGSDSTDHPRSCGANGSRLTCWGAVCGSSPLVRGQLIGGRLQRFHKRIIPARAGPTRRVRYTCWL